MGTTSMNILHAVRLSSPSSPLATRTTARERVGLTIKHINREFQLDVFVVTFRVNAQHTACTPCKMLTPGLMLRCSAAPEWCCVRCAGTPHSRCVLLTAMSVAVGSARTRTGNVLKINLCSTKLLNKSLCLNVCLQTCLLRTNVNP